MRIGIVSNFFPSGAGYVTKAYQASLIEQGNEVFIYARCTKKEFRKDSDWCNQNNVEVAKLFNEEITASGLIKWVKRLKLEVVLFNEQRYWSPVIELKKAQINVLIGSYIDYYTQKTVPLFTVYDFLFCNTARHFSVFREFNGAYYIPWGTKVYENEVNIDLVDNTEVRFVISAGWQLGKGADRRGSLIALRAFLATKGNAKLDIYSQSGEHEIDELVLSLIESDSRVELVVGTFDPFPYDKYDVYLYPSRLDGIGLTLPESMACGLAVITTNSAPMNEFVKDGVTGLLVNVERFLGRDDGYYWPENIVDNNDLALKIQYYIDNPDVVVRHKNSSISHSRESLSWRKNSANLSELISELKEQSKPRSEKELSQLEKRVRLIDSQLKPNILDLLKKIARILYLKTLDTLN